MSLTLSLSVYLSVCLSLLSNRVQQLELEIKKGNHPKRGPEPSAPIHDTATAEELAKARKDLETAERLAKQADQNVKSKDAQLKRALETITRLKTQLQEAHTQITVSCFYPIHIII